MENWKILRSHVSSTFFRFNINVLFSLQLVHGLHVRVKGAGQYEIWFGISQRKVRFSKELCLVTRLKFGGSSIVGTDRVVLIRNGICERY